MLHAALFGLILANTAPAQVAVIPFQRTQALSPDDALLLQEVVAGLVDESPRFALIQVSLEDLMAGRMPQFVIAGSLRRARSGAYELELNLQVKGQTQPISSTLRQGADLPALAGAIEDVLPSLFGEKPASSSASDAGASQAAPSTTNQASRSFFRRSWQPYAAIGGAVLGATGGVLWVASDEGLDDRRSAYDALDAGTDPEGKEALRLEYNSAIDRQTEGRKLAVGVVVTGVVGVILGLIP
jgi:hypothetical protein